MQQLINKRYDENISENPSSTPKLTTLSWSRSSYSFIVVTTIVVIAITEP